LPKINEYEMKLKTIKPVKSKKVLEMQKEFNSKQGKNV